MPTRGSSAGQDSLAAAHRKRFWEIANFPGIPTTEVIENEMKPVDVSVVALKALVRHQEPQLTDVPGSEVSGNSTI
jgi:hypothetical protein